MRGSGQGRWPWEFQWEAVSCLAWHVLPLPLQEDFRALFPPHLGSTPSGRAIYTTVALPARRPWRVFSSRRLCPWHTLPLENSHVCFSCGLWLHPLQKCPSPTLWWRNPVSPQTRSSPTFWSQGPFTLLNIVKEFKELLFMRVISVYIYHFRDETQEHFLTI